MRASGPGEIPLSRSIAGKLTLAALAMVLCAIAILYAVTRTMVLHHAQAMLQASIDTDMAGLVDIHVSGGRDELVRRLQDRITFDRSADGRFYLLVDGQGRRLAGNLDAFPPFDPSRSQAGTFTLSGGREVLGRATLLSEGLRLVVARDQRGIEGLLQSLRNGFLIAGLVSLLVTLVIGNVYARRLQRRLRRIEQQHRLLELGEPGIARQPASADDDEIDLLAHRTHHMLERMRELVNAYRDVSDHVAHEVRTPLMHIDQRMRLILERSVDPLVTESLSKARGEIRGIVRLLESLLDISAARARIGDTTGLERTDLSELVADLVDIYRDGAEDIGSRIDARITPRVEADVDPMQIRRLLGNLLDNALKYSPPGSTVTVELASGPVLTVQDDGPGIPVERRASIFERFSGNRTAGTPGHGLGLALAQAIAQRHGMELQLERSSSGARFVMRPSTDSTKSSFFGKESTP